MRASDVDSSFVLTPRLWLVAALLLLTLLGSVALGAALPGTAPSAAPDGSVGPVRARLGPGCDRVPAARARIASAALVTDEILLELLERSRWAAVSYVVDWPSASAVSARFDQSIPRTWGTAEHLLRIDADRVFVSDHTAAGATPALLASAGRCVVDVPAPHNVDELLAAILWVGTTTGTRSRASALVAQLQARLARLPHPSPTDRSRPKPAALVLQGLRAFGSDTLPGDCLGRAHLANAATELGVHQTASIPTEVLLVLELDLLFLAAPVPTLRKAEPQDLPSGVPWQATPVVRHGRIFAVPEAWVSSLSHHALRACEAYAEAAWGQQWRH